MKKKIGMVLAMNYIIMLILFVVGVLVHTSRGGTIPFWLGSLIVAVHALLFYVLGKGIIKRRKIYG